MMLSTISASSFIASFITIVCRAAFQQLDNPRISNEQRILEVKIERTHQQLAEIADERVKGSDFGF
jgi:hypothetical protein